MLVVLGVTSTAQETSKNWLLQLKLLRQSEWSRNGFRN
jgi:hypothetical protein